MHTPMLAVQVKGDALMITRSSPLDAVMVRWCSLRAATTLDRVRRTPVRLCGCLNSVTLIASIGATIVKMGSQSSFPCSTSQQRSVRVQSGGTLFTSTVAALISSDRGDSKGWCYARRVYRKFSMTSCPRSIATIGSDSYGTYGSEPNHHVSRNLQ